MAVLRPHGLLSPPAPSPLFYSQALAKYGKLPLSHQKALPPHELAQADTPKVSKNANVPLKKLGRGLPLFHTHPYAQRTLTLVWPALGSDDFRDFPHH